MNVSVIVPPASIASTRGLWSAMPHSSPQPIPRTRAAPLRAGGVCGDRVGDPVPERRGAVVTPAVDHDQLGAGDRLRGRASAGTRRSVGSSAPWRTTVGASTPAGAPSRLPEQIEATSWRWVPSGLRPRCVARAARSRAPAPRPSRSPGEPIALRAGRSSDVSLGVLAGRVISTSIAAGVGWPDVARARGRHHRGSERTRSGCSIASVCATNPPSETPTTCAASSPSASSRPAASVGHVGEQVGRVVELLARTPPSPRGRPASREPGRAPAVTVVEADHPKPAAGERLAEPVGPGHHLRADPGDQQQRRVRLRRRPSGSRARSRDRRRRRALPTTSTAASADMRGTLPGALSVRSFPDASLVDRRRRDRRLRARRVAASDPEPRRARGRGPADGGRRRGGGEPRARSRPRACSSATASASRFEARELQLDLDDELEVFDRLDGFGTRRDHDRRLPRRAVRARQLRADPLRHRALPARLQRAHHARGAGRRGAGCAQPPRRAAGRPRARRLRRLGCRDPARARHDPRLRRRPGPGARRRDHRRRASPPDRSPS